MSHRTSNASVHCLVKCLYQK